MSAHTPGPWTINGASIIGYPESNIAVARVWGNVGQPKEANARLIAAAPELLEALEIVLVQFGAYVDGDGAAKFHAVNIGRSAIAKARGES